MYEYNINQNVIRNNSVKYHHGNQIGFEEAHMSKNTSPADGPFEEKVQSGAKVYNYDISMNWWENWLSV